MKLKTSSSPWSVFFAAEGALYPNTSVNEYSFEITTYLEM